MKNIIVKSIALSFIVFSCVSETAEDLASDVNDEIEAIVETEETSTEDEVADEEESTDTMEETEEETTDEPEVEAPEEPTEEEPAEEESETTEDESTEDEPEAMEEEEDASAKVTYVADVKPIYDMYCASCHADGAARGNYELGTYDLAADGAQVALFRMELDPNDRSVMPQGGKLEQETIDVIAKWIEDGLLEQ